MNSENNIKLIPTNYLFEDLTFSHINLTDHTTLGLSRNTVKNFIQNKHTPQQRTKDKFFLAIVETITQMPGMDVDTDLLDSVIEDSSKVSMSRTFDIFKDAFSKYTLSKFKDVVFLEQEFAYMAKEIKKIHKGSSSQLYFDIIKSVEFPGNMLSYNLVNNNYFSIEDAIMTQNRIWVDGVFYRMAARDVEENYRFYRQVRGNKSLVAPFLPCIQNQKIKYPVALLFDKIIREQGYHSINEFAISIPQLTNRPSQQKDESKKRMVYKYRSGEAFPSREFVELMSDTIFKDKLNNRFTDPDDIHELKEQTISGFWYLNILHRLLKIILKNQAAYGLDKAGVFDFFERYLYWHNYHSVHFKVD